MLGSYDHQFLVYSQVHTCIVRPVTKLLLVVLYTFFVHLFEHVRDDILTQCLAQRSNGGFVLLVFGHKGVVGRL